MSLISHPALAPSHWQPRVSHPNRTEPSPPGRNGAAGCEPPAPSACRATCSAPGPPGLGLERQARWAAWGRPGGFLFCLGAAWELSSDGLVGVRSSKEVPSKAAGRGCCFRHGVSGSQFGKMATKRGSEHPLEENSS